MVTRRQPEYDFYPSGTPARGRLPRQLSPLHVPTEAEAAAEAAAAAATGAPAFRTAHPVDRVGAVGPVGPEDGGHHGAWVPLGPQLAWTAAGHRRVDHGRAVTAVVPRRGRRQGSRRGRFGVGVAAGVVVATALGAGATVGAVRLLGPSGERAVWAVTRVTTPASVEGRPRLHSAQLDRQARAEQARVQAAGAGALTMQVAFYGSAGRSVLGVVAGRPDHPLAADEQDAVRQGFTASLGRAGVTLASRDAGALGGWFGCGTVPATAPSRPGTTCVAVDAGAVVSVTVQATGKDAEAFARRVREAFVRRG